MNVTKSEDWQKAIDKAVQLWGKVDILVNNAGTTYPNKVSEPQFNFDFKNSLIDARVRARTT